MKQLLFALLFIPTLLFAQNEQDQQYLEGAIPLEDGKVVFTHELQAPSLSKSDIFQQLTDWGKHIFKAKNSRVTYTNAEKGEIAISGEEYLVFSSNFMSLDRSLIKYHLIIECKEHEAIFKIKNIRYEYEVSFQEEPLKYVAEKWITDEYALNKKKDKLTRNGGKFRKHTINYVNDIFNAADIALGLKKMTINPITKETQVSQIQPSEQGPAPKETVKSTQGQVKQMDGFVHFEADKVPSTIIDMLTSNKVMMECGSEKFSEQNIAWKGIGTMFGKKIATISVKKGSPVYKATLSCNIYRIAFYKPDTTNDGPWIIFECNKQGETSEGDEVIFIGEITHVWIK